jgi:hypothetical protein
MLRETGGMVLNRQDINRQHMKRRLTNIFRRHGLEDSQLSPYGLASVSLRQHHERFVSVSFSLRYSRACDFASGGEPFRRQT